MRLPYAFVFTLLISGGLQSQELTAILHNPGGDDGGQEAVQIEGPAGASLSGYYLIVIDGDGGAAGDVDEVIDLGSLSPATIGSNGLFVIQESAGGLNPAPAPETNVATLSMTLENGTTTFLLVQGWSGSEGDDLDTDDDGTLDAQPWSTVISAVAARESSGSDREYATQLGGTSVQLSQGGGNGCIGGTPVNAGFLFLDGGTWNGTVVSENAEGRQVYSSTQTYSAGCSNLSGVYGGEIIALGNPQGFVPVEWLSFTAVREKGRVALRWATATESENRGFWVERSVDGRRFVALDWIAAGERPEELQEYASTDHTPPPGIVYYRLRQEDYDGAVDFSPVVRVAGAEGRSISVFPTVSSGEIRWASATTPRSVRIIDGNGSTVATPRPETASFTFGARPAGWYFVRLETREGRIETYRVLFR